MKKVTLKQIKKELVKLQEDELKDVLEFLTDDEEEEQQEEVQEETKEEEVKEEVAETPKKEVEKEQPKYATLEDIQGLLEQFKEQFVPKEKLEEIEIKAKPFGVEQSKSKPTSENKSKTVQDYLAMVNQKR